MTGKLSDAPRDVLAERVRQVEEEGWTPEHDDGHADGEIAKAAACYAEFAAMPETGRTTFSGVPLAWPWDWKWWKPKTRRRDLVRAAALIVAEIERGDRAAGGTEW